jgi:hypothetical protein
MGESLFGSKIRVKAQKAQGFYYRRVKLADGTDGFIRRFDFSE